MRRIPQATSRDERVPMWAFVRVGPSLAVRLPERLLFVLGTGMAAGDVEVSGCLAVFWQSADELVQ